MPTAEFSTDPLAWQAKIRPEKVAAIALASGERLSYRGLDELADRGAAWLTARLDDAAGRVAFLGRNSIAMLVLALAAERSGAIFVPLNWRLAGAEIAALVADCTPSVMVADSEFLDALPGAMVADAMLDEVRAHATGRPPELDAARPAILLYTSGTTGQPKGTVLTAGNAYAASVNFSLVGEVGAGSVILSDLPMFHTIGLIAVARTSLMMGSTLVLTDRFEPSRTLRALGDEALGITHYFAVPMMAEMLERDPAFLPGALKRLHAIFVGGAPLPPALAERYLGYGVPLVNGYGMSEVGTAIHVPVDRNAVRASNGAVGLPAPHVAVRLVADGRDVATGEIGEVWLSGPSVSPGYWNRPAETEAAFSGGWYRSGDLARREANGFYRIVDRLKDMYISGGENVYPAEVEAVLRDHPQIADAAVVGVSDPRWGETGIAFVVHRPGLAFDAASAGAHCAARLAKYKCPHRYIAIAAIPRNAAGKILKPELRAWLNAGEFE